MGDFAAAARVPSAPSPDAASSPPVNARPTNNQFLYQAHFHWEHFPHELGEAPEGLPVTASARPANKTEACTSVTTAFLQVLAILNGVEVRRTRAPRNVLKLLSIHTRRTKVVDLQVKQVGVVKGRDVRVQRFELICATHRTVLLRIGERCQASVE